MAWGGKRRGAGRRSKIENSIKAQILAEASAEAEYALGVPVAYMHNENMEPSFRLACAQVVMDRVWGKPAQRQDMQGSLTLKHEHPDLSKLSDTDLDALADIAARLERNNGGEGQAAS